MPTKAAPWTSWLTKGPLGGWGRKLGFRWVFPIGTLPVPFHPLVLPLSLLALIGWTIFRIASLAVDNAAGGGWAPLLGWAFVLGCGLSVPVLAWMLIALGGRLIQSGLILCAMILLAVEVGSGREDAWFAPIPIAFFGLWIVQSIGGRILRRHLLRRWNNFVPINLDDRPVVIADGPHWTNAIDLMMQNNLSEVWDEDASNTAQGRGYFRLNRELSSQLLALSDGALPVEWKFETHADFTILIRKGAVPNAIRLSRRPWKAPMAMLAPELTEVLIDDGTSRQIVFGRIATLLPVPLFEAFHWTAIFGGKSQWRFGFAYCNPKTIGPGWSRLEGVLALPATPQTASAARASQLRALLEADLDARAQRLSAFRGIITSDPAAFEPHFEELRNLQKRGSGPLGPDAGPFLLNWLQRARDARAQRAVSMAAGLIAALPDEAFHQIVPKLFDTINSRKLTLEWKLVKDFDPKPLPPKTPVFGNSAGFGLIFMQPELFIRLGDLYPLSRNLVEKLSEEMRLPEAIEKARARWRGEQVSSA